MHRRTESISRETRRFIFWEPIRGQRKASSVPPGGKSHWLSRALQRPLCPVSDGLVSDGNPAPNTPTRSLPCNPASSWLESKNIADENHIGVPLPRSPLCLMQAHLRDELMPPSFSSLWPVFMVHVGCALLPAIPEAGYGPQLCPGRDTPPSPPCAPNHICPPPQPTL